jgi:hypothetical protein
MPTKQTVPLVSSRAAPTVIISSLVHSSASRVGLFSVIDVL